MERNPANTGKPEAARTAFGRKRERVPVKPFLKWAGGKGQLLKEIEAYYPFGPDMTKYAEPFAGGGAVLFDILSRYDLEAVYISDINAELINAYRVIRDEIDGLIALLSRYQAEYHPLDAAARRAYYARMRDRFNALKVSHDAPENIEKAALMIFLNRTCFNGLYRVNRRGRFNVPVGAYKNPLICDEENLRSVSGLLQPVTIVCGDYRESAAFIDRRTFVYFDPPYRPLTDTASFTAYTEFLFDDAKQVELAQFVEEMHRKGAKIVVSNSDPKNVSEEDNFFENIYAPHQIKRVEATRMINRNSGARGKIRELLISNFEAARPMVSRDFSVWLSGFRDSLADCVTGVEAGLDSGNRKRRGGRLMEDLVERYIRDAGFVKDCTYFKKMDVRQITEKWGVDLSAFSSQGKGAKPFDFVVRTGAMLYGVEANFYGRAGARLNEAARSYQTLALEAEAVDGFTFVWFTDGRGWLRARDSLEEAFGAMKHLYNINDLERGIVREVFR